MKVELNAQQELEDVAFGYLYEDVRNPDVGMGIGTQTAVRYALEFLTAKFGIEFQSEVNTERANEAIRQRAKSVRLPGY